MILEVTTDTFQTEVLDSDIPVIIDFFAPWCGPCRMVSPIVEELSGDLDGKVKFVKVNTDENAKIASTYGIRSIPSLILFKNGQSVASIVGFRPKASLIEWVTQNL